MNLVERNLYLHCLKSEIENEKDIKRIENYYERLSEFYPKIINNEKVLTVFNKYGIDKEKADLFKMLQSDVHMESQVMKNQEIRFRIICKDTGFSYVVVDSRNKLQGGNPHQNSHEHFYTSEVWCVEKGYAIASEILSSGIVKLVRYNEGEYWTSIPGHVHNTSLSNNAYTITLKTASPLQDWYGTGNVINSKSAYYLDSKTKTLDLDEMNYIIKNYNGMITQNVVENFGLPKRYEEVLKNQEVNPYEILITKENREQIKNILLETKNNDLAAFYIHLASNNLDLANDMAKTFGSNFATALEFADKEKICSNVGMEKAKSFAKIKRII